MSERILTPEQIEAIERFTELISYDVDLETIEGVLDVSIWDITRFKLSDSEFTGYDGAENELFWLRKLKEVCGGKVFW
ncbi:hypothetical protein ABIB40_000033 [Pedobacter sp. UYP30]|uniref:hypothetical protein n=1 Tax=Pedobacter sp. UYP30 TaxID=1756400 RepID=UPI003394EAB4